MTDPGYSGSVISFICPSCCKPRYTMVEKLVLRPKASHHEGVEDRVFEAKAEIRVLR